jgi:hypothetical protein
MHDNQVWQNGANGSIRCMTQAFGQENWTTLAEWQALGHDKGTVSKNVSDLDASWLVKLGMDFLKQS